jgi:hypothetical protein
VRHFQGVPSAEFPHRAAEEDLIRMKHVRVEHLDVRGAGAHVARLKKKVAAQILIRQGVRQLDGHVIVGHRGRPLAIHRIDEKRGAVAGHKYSPPTTHRHVVRRVAGLQGKLLRNSFQCLPQLGFGRIYQRAVGPESMLFEHGQGIGVGEIDAYMIHESQTGLVDLPDIFCRQKLLHIFGHSSAPVHRRSNSSKDRKPCAQRYRSRLSAETHQFASVGVED